MDMGSSGAAFERSSQAAGFRAGPAVFRISRRTGCHPQCETRNNDKTFSKDLSPFGTAVGLKFTLQSPPFMPSPSVDKTRAPFPRASRAAA